MSKLIPVILLLLVGASACGKKPAEIEMQLPTPSPTATSVVLATPTFLPSASPTVVQPEVHYFIEDIKGTVLVNSGDSTVPESAAEGESVEPGDTLITKDGSEATLALNQDTMVHLDADSQVKVADLSDNSSGGFTSKLELLLGNLLSEVEKLDQSHSSFEVEAGGVVCAVRGTAFEVQKQGDNISTSTYHGQVAMQKDGKTQLVNANEHSTYSLSGNGFRKQRKLSLSERKHYQTWTKTKTRVQQKRADRIAGHHTLVRPAVKTPVRSKPAPKARTGAHKPQPAKHTAPRKPAQRKQTKAKSKTKPRPAPHVLRPAPARHSQTNVRKNASKPQDHKALPAKKDKKKKKQN